MRDMLDDAAELSSQGERVACAMVVDTRRSAPRPLGSRLFVTESGEMRGSVSGGCVESDVVLRAQEVLRDGTPALVQYGITDDDAFDVGLPCGGEIEVFIAPFDGDEGARVRQAVESGERLSVTTVLSGPDAGTKSYGGGDAHSSAGRETPETFVGHYAPAPVIIIFRAVDTAQRCAGAANKVGSHAIVSDARAKFARAQRLPDADEIVVGWPALAYEL